MKHTLTVLREPGPKRGIYTHRIVCERCGYEALKLEVKEHKVSKRGLRLAETALEIVHRHLNDCNERLVDAVHAY